MNVVMSKKDKTNYKNKYNKENYSRIGIYVEPEMKDRIKLHAEGTGESMNAFIIRAINETMEKDNAEIEPVSCQEYLQSVKRITDRNRAEREERKKKKGEWDGKTDEKRT